MNDFRRSMTLNDVKNQKDKSQIGLRLFGVYDNKSYCLKPFVDSMISLCLTLSSLWYLNPNVDVRRRTLLLLVLIQNLFKGTLEIGLKHERVAKGNLLSFTQVPSANAEK